MESGMKPLDPKAKTNKELCAICGKPFIPGETRELTEKGNAHIMCANPTPKAMSLDEILDKFIAKWDKFHYLPLVAELKTDLTHWADEQRVEELEDIKNVCMMPGATVSGINRVVGTRIARYKTLTGGEENK